MKKAGSILFLSSLESMVFIFLYDYLFQEFYPQSVHDINWGISLEIAMIEFIIFSILLNTFLMINARISAIWPIITAAFLYSVTWINELLTTPTLALKLLASAGVGFLSYFLFVRLLNGITKKFIQTPHKN